MGYEAFPCHSFGGLNTRDAPDEVGSDGAIDLFNVDFDKRGAVRSRSGYAAFTSSALTNRVASLSAYYKTDGTTQILAGCGTRLEALTTAGAVVAGTGSETGLTTGIWAFCRFGAPGSEVAYAGNGKNLLYKWDGADWTSVANSPKARYLAVMAVDQGNRMVAAGFDDSATAGAGASQAYTSRVWFSNAGAPETWGANNYVDLTPGDGEAIQNVVAWREYVIVFKETKFFVFYGTSTDASGNPVFNYRTIDTGIGLTSPRAVAMGPESVYFLARDGIYVTTGGDPTRISDLISPAWKPTTNGFFTQTINSGSITSAAMAYLDGRIFLAFPYTPGTGVANQYIFVHDPNWGWTFWDIAASCFTVFRPAYDSELFFGYATGSNHIGSHAPRYTTDDGSGITSYYRTGFYDAGIENEKEIRETQLWGTGTVGFSLSRDFGALGSATNVTLGTSPAIAAGRARVDKRGSLFSHKIASVSGGAWTIHRCTPYLREMRGTGNKTS
jgi:hypothetical protein